MTMDASSPMTPEYRELLIRLIRDNWAAEAANLSVKHQTSSCPLHLAPTVRDRATLAAYWADECRHAMIFADLLGELGAPPSEEDYDALRPTELLRLPVTSWTEFGLFQLFADSAGVVHLSDYRECSYLPLRKAAVEILRDEGRHVALGVKNLRTALELPGGREKAIEVLPTWYAAALPMFGRPDRASDRDQRLVAAGLRSALNAELRTVYRERIDAQLTRLGLPIPEVS